MCVRISAAEPWSLITALQVGDKGALYCPLVEKIIKTVWRQLWGASASVFYGQELPNQSILILHRYNCRYRDFSSVCESKYKIDRCCLLLSPFWDGQTFIRHNDLDLCPLVTESKYLCCPKWNSSPIMSLAWIPIQAGEETDLRWRESQNLMTADWRTRYRVWD